ncbi:hypothetical protein A3I27_00680 [Candidatus Giovannonibacteria bacterium RIFCSPLOWO2_02_FULL_43_11b]|uniref:Uncharacterized protein n=1 Tax=Candidatus Giovannonibacteria bacterium RIFCSPHIGHO2_12_FULL_43_15 TaxID=1798341 RepID=A0A1F5WPL2_9BACT|nr:MAG: hypothetical protein A3B97_01370 [Candidatus Giovannonibacteria bacterium RIFCSPHIGHO2_02_FULL_43_32]OGF77598.1 MAG: hypothetical protein A3F23_00130 [Candidatus Giovannonibacteria bacterium RIFCSPHIGHO2_12_FULL_43_15]OGF79284.1 MAG: hypothetical protein A3A15_01440 [Candidatus Giovannonibacteria bacterium RIFCSPLOWO2_01_FULL_43_60]OGF90169.1 MAG: hypothetical protein A3I27_00680 [Candidatus Giovannonibacteria bacterium RIFCSPLOWO2_02_FULL_43_11b]
MTHQKALEILIKLIEKNPYFAKASNGEERKAILTAIGVLSWTKLAGARIKKMMEERKARRGI